MSNAQENKPRVYCFYSKDQVDHNSFGDADFFIHREDYLSLQSENEKLKEKLRMAVKHLKKAQNIIVSHECEECENFTEVRYEIKPIVECLQKIEEIK